MRGMAIDQLSHEYHDIEANVMEAFKGRNIRNDMEVRSGTNLRTELGLPDHLIRDICIGLLQRYNVSSLTQQQLNQMQTPRLIAMYIHRKLICGSEERNHASIITWPYASGIMQRFA